MGTGVSRHESAPSASIENEAKTEELIEPPAAADGAGADVVPDLTALDLVAQPTPTAVPAAAPRSGAVRYRAVTHRVRETLAYLSLDERLGRIVLAAVLAALLWFYVTSLENPAQVTQFSGLSPEIRNQAATLKIINTLPTVNVTVQAPQNVMGSLRQSDIHPYVDLQRLEAGVHDVPVLVDVNGLADRNSMNLSVSPRTVQVQLEVQSTRVYSMAVRVSGTPPFGFAAEPAQVDPDQVKVTGSESAVNRISQVIVTADITDKTTTQRGYKSPVALDTSGQEITGLAFDPSGVLVVIPIKSLVISKVVPVHVPVVGNPAPGFSASEINLDPTNVTICCAPSSVLEPILRVDTRPVALTGTTSTVVTTTDIILPSGVQLYPGQSNQISVTVRIDTFQTNLQLSVAPAVANLAANDTAVVSPASLDLTLSGTLAQFQSLKPADVVAVVDAQGLGPGTYDIDPQITVPHGITLAKVNPAKVSLSIIPPTPVPPTPTHVPTPAPTATVNAAALETATPLPSATRTSALPPTAVPSRPSSTPTHTATLVPSPTPTATPTHTPTAVVGPESSGSPQATHSPSPTGPELNATPPP